MVDLAVRLQSEADEAAAIAKDYRYRANHEYLHGKAAALYSVVHELRAALGAEDPAVPRRWLVMLARRIDEPWVEERPEFSCIVCGMPCDAQGGHL